MAENLIFFRRRVRSVRNTQKITRAMKTVAAVKLRRANTELNRTLAAHRQIVDFLRTLSPYLDPQHHPLLRARESGVRLLVGISADKGLCGSFNSRLLKAVDDRVGEWQRSGVEFQLIAVGNKIARYLAKRNIPVRQAYPAVMNRPTFSQAAQLADFLLKVYSEEPIESVAVVFTEFVSAARQQVTQRALLPLTPEWGVREMEAKEQIIFEPDPVAISATLIPRYLRSLVWRMLLESAASEQAARMVAMDQATQNASDMIHSLTLTMNKMRQAAITKELLEIITATEALNK